MRVLIDGVGVCDTIAYSKTVTTGGRVEGEFVFPYTPGVDIGKRVSTLDEATGAVQTTGVIHRIENGYGETRISTLDEVSVILERTVPQWKYGDVAHVKGTLIEVMVLRRASSSSFECVLLPGPQGLVPSSGYYWAAEDLEAIP